MQCGGGQQTRTRNIERASAHGGRACTALHETRDCNAHPCPRDCLMGAWSSWDACSVSCGTGTQARSRVVEHGAQHGGIPCGATAQSQVCTASPCPSDCQFTWGQYGGCSKDCGGGVETRLPVVTAAPQNGGVACPQPETRPCNTQPCEPCYSSSETRDCVLSEWGAWGTCSVTCGNGVVGGTHTAPLRAYFHGLQRRPVRRSDSNGRLQHPGMPRRLRRVRLGQFRSVLRHMRRRHAPAPPHSATVQFFWGCRMPSAR